MASNEQENNMEIGSQPDAGEVMENVSLDDDKESDTDDTFGHAPETTTSPSSRDLTRASKSTISSFPETTPAPNKESNGSERLSLTTSPVLSGDRTENESISAVKSPLSHRRISTGSLDEVSLIDELPPPKDTAPSFAGSILTRFSRSSTASSQTTSAGATLRPPSPKVPPAAPAPTPTPAPEKPIPPPVVRRSPFSWLTRAAAPKEAPKEVPKSRRATNSSVLSNSSTTTTTTTTTVNSELLLARIEANKESISKADAHEKEELLKGTDTLRENFRKIREREASVSVEGQPTKGSLPAGQQGNDSHPQSSTNTELSPSTTSSSLTVEDEIDWDLWQSLVEDPYKVASTMPTELNHAIQAGIPQTIRGTVWQSLAQSKSLELEGIYREVIALGPQSTAIDARPLFGTYWPPISTSLASSPGVGSPSLGSPKSDKGNAAMLLTDAAKKTVAQLEKAIKRDLGERTSFGKYKVDQKALLNICKAYALFDPEVGYTQGMTFVATPLLMNMPEEEAFCLFVKLMCKYNLRSMFQEKMKGLELRLYQFDRLLEDLEPRLSVHLRRQGIESSLYAAQWFLTLFTYKFPLQLVLRVFDLLFSEVLEGAVLKFGIIMMRKNAEALLEKEFETLGPFLKERLFDVYLDATPSASSLKEAGFFGNGGEKEIYRANIMVQDACSIKITREMLLKYEVEWTEAERIKRQNEMEIENLKYTNSNLAARLKKLEEELELLNKEHVDLLNGMVVKNMENAHLSEENAQLVQQVEELKQTVEKQPMEVEEMYKAEVNRLMERQLEVHHENQALEEQMMEMEKELVDTKMQLAEMSSSYDTLHSKWQDLKKALRD